MSTKKQGFVDNYDDEGIFSDMGHSSRFSLIAPILVVVVVLVDTSGNLIIDGTLTVSAVVTQILVVNWLWRRAKGTLGMAWVILSVLATGAVVAALLTGHGWLPVFIVGVVTALVLPRSAQVQDQQHGHWWETLFNHPARVLFTTFLDLCFFGTLLLLLPGTTTHNAIAPVDAAFTSVSAVCVTGLAVLDPAMISPCSGRP